MRFSSLRHSVRASWRLHTGLPEIGGERIYSGIFIDDSVFHSKHAYLSAEFEDNRRFYAKGKREAIMRLSGSLIHASVETRRRQNPTSPKCNSSGYNAIPYGAFSDAVFALDSLVDSD